MAEETQRHKTTIVDLNRKKAEGIPLFEAAVYDFPTAQVADEAGLDVFVVGDSLGMNLLGFEDTLPVTLEMIELFTGAVRRGAPLSFVIADLPLGSCFSAEQAYESSIRLLRAGADGVKIEGGLEITPIVEQLASRGVLVHGHIGLTPQSYRALGGYRTQGRDADAAIALVRSARGLEDAGCQLILLEAMPHQVAAAATRATSIPILGVGAGADCDGVALVLNDFLGIAHIDHPPRYAQRYADLRGTVRDAIGRLHGDIVERRYPAPEHWYGMRASELKRFQELLDQEQVAGR